MSREREALLNRIEVYETKIEEERVSPSRREYSTEDALIYVVEALKLYGFASGLLTAEESEW